MMIKRYGTIDISEWYVRISRDTDNNPNNPNSLPVYFDAALSRRVVKERVVVSGYTMIKHLKTKGVLVPEEEEFVFVYDPVTFNKEKGYTEIEQFLHEKGNDILVFKGTCECSYDPEHEDITVAIQTKEKVI